MLNLTAAATGYEWALQSAEGASGGLIEFTANNLGGDNKYLAFGSQVGDIVMGNIIGGETGVYTLLRSVPKMIIKNSGSLGQGFIE